jgi:YVTN family beta-propeller protein
MGVVRLSTICQTCPGDWIGMKMGLGAAAVAVLLVAGPVHGAGPALFVFEPLAVTPGGSLTVSGSRFSASSAAVAIVLVSGSGQTTSLGIAGLQAGQFRTTVTIPAATSPGRYYLNVADSTSTIALNLTGSPTVTPTNYPWFTFSPGVALPRATLTFSGSGFNPASTVAGIEALAGNGTATLLGYVPLSGGSFNAKLVLPATLLPQTSYRVIAKDSGPNFAVNTEGPLTVVNAAAGVAVPLGLYPIGAAVDPVLNRVFLANGGDDTVSVLDGNTNLVLATVPVGPLPCAIAVNPTSGFVFVANANGNSVSVLNAQTNSVVATVPVGAYPCAIAAMPATNQIYVGNSGGSDISVIDGNTNTVTTTISVGKGPWGIAVNPSTNRVYAAIVYQNTVAVIDGGSNTVLATVPTQGVDPDAVAVNASTNQVYVANYFSDNLSVLDGTTNGITALISTGKQPSGVAANPTTGNVYVSNYASNTVTVINSSNTVLATLASGSIPNGVGINPDTDVVYVPNSDSSNVLVIQDNR